MSVRSLRNAAKWLCILSAILTTACDSPLVREAKRAEEERRVISNELMSAAYPHSFRPGEPAYLERDFEAGADLICDEIRRNYERDVCSDPEINWRNIPAPPDDA